jgi:hypothetical protein
MTRTASEGTFATLCRRLLSTAGIALAAILAAPTVAKACAGGDCESEPLPLIAELKGGKTCYGIFGMGVPFLNPYNDTRVNLALLLEDRKLLKLALVPLVPMAGPPPGTLALPAEHAVPFRMESLRGLKSGTPAPPSPSPAQAELLALAARLQLDGARAEEALTRVSATQTGRCAAESPETLLDFVRAVADEAGLGDAERAILAGERLRVGGLCLDMADPPQPLAVTSSAGQAFAAYLGAARHFYRDQLEAAEGDFAALGASPAAWVSEAARYMIGRVHLNQAQFRAFKDFGLLDPAAVDQQKLALAKTDFRGYLDTHPAGRYAASARGLFRRIDWLGRDAGAFTQDLATALAAYDGHPPATERMFELLDEVDSKYLSESGLSPDHELAWQVPELAATTVLTRMRDFKTGSGDSLYRPVAADTVKQHRAELAAAASPLLVDFLDLAQAYWIDHDPAKVVQATESRKPSAAMGNVEFSLLVLRGIALEATGRGPDANALWHGLLGTSDDALRWALPQLALALNDERTGKLADVFAPDSVVREPALHRPLLKHAAPPDLLRAVVARPDTSAEDKSTALFTLLYKQLVQGDVGGFGDTLAQFPPQQFQDIDGLHLFLWKGQSAPNYACPALAESARRLAAAPTDPAALNCVGVFFYRFEDGLSPGSKPPADELGGTPDRFAGKVRTRLDLYLAVIGNPTAQGDAEAYALYRAVNCFASSGSNHCGDQDIPKEQRKRWFDRLKQTYKDNAWGRAQKYWW